MLQLPAIRRTIARAPSFSLSVVGFAAIVATWMLFRIASVLQPGYDPMRDTISSLASHGASQPWIGMLGIATAALATMIAALSVRSLSQPAALALGAAGFALLLVAATRIICPGGAAGCAMGPITDGSAALAHTVALILFEVTFVGAIGSAAICLWRAGTPLTSVTLVVGMVLSILLFAVVPLEVGMKQRLWLLVNTLLICGSLLVPFHPVEQNAHAGERPRWRHGSSGPPFRGEA